MYVRASTQQCDLDNFFDKNIQAELIVPEDVDNYQIYCVCEYPVYSAGVYDSGQRWVYFSIQCM